MKAVPEVVPDMERPGFTPGLVTAAFALRDADEALEAGLATARRARGWTFVALPAPIVAAPALVAACCPEARNESGPLDLGSEPLVAWTSRELTLVGIGSALELRGNGAARWRDIIDAARAISAVPTQSEPVRPRLLGGLAFAAGAADRAPWIGFGDAWFTLPRWTYMHDGARASILLAVDARDAHQAARWREELAVIRAALAATFVAKPQPPLSSIDPGDRDAWRDQVRSITDEIARGDCAKIVAARSAVVTLAGEPRAADLLAELDARHAECVRVLVRPPGAGALVAATPERLVRLAGDTVSCDALAGTLERADEGAMLLASAKDRREHELVVEAIASALRGQGADVMIPTAPSVRTLRHVHHLHSPIAARLRAPRHVLELAEALHPTPAVGGTPTRVATDWIAAREPTARGWYAAPVGWFDLDGNGELAVAIRSGLLAGERAHLWAGAGIVAGSDPDRELAETEIKLRAMLGALGVAR